MAEGAPSPSSRPPLPRPPSADNAEPPTAASPGAPSPLTYIIQVPKDHIYRVPPPENAHLAEQYRAQLSAARRGRAPCLRLLLHVLCVAITVAIPLLIAALVFYIVVRPTLPTFYVDYVVATSSSNAAYDVKIEVSNPSLRMGYLIEKGGGGSAKLSYRGKVAAEGEPPHFYLEAAETRMFKMSLYGKRKDAAEESLRGAKKAVDLQLAMEMPVKVEIGSLRSWAMKMTVDCTVRSKSLKSMTSLLSQECKARVKL